MPWPLRRTSFTVSPRVICPYVYREAQSLPLPGHIALDNVSNEVEHILKEIAYKDERMAGEPCFLSMHYLASWADTPHLATTLQRSRPVSISVPPPSFVMLKTTTLQPLTVPTKAVLP
jgi:hypothetical protein